MSADDKGKGRGLKLPDGSWNRHYVPDFDTVVLPYCTWYQDDFLGGIRGMTAAEIGVYSVMLNLMYSRGTALAMPETRLARFCGLPVNKLKPIILSLIEEGKILVLAVGYWNERVDKVLVKRKSEHLNNSFAGTESARKRNENKGACEHTLNGGAASDQPYSEAQNIGGGDSARARVTTSLKKKIIDAINTVPDPDDDPVTFVSASDEVVAEKWLGDLALSEDECIAVVAEVMADKLDGHPNSLSYFTPAMRRYAGAKATGPIKPISSEKQRQRGKPEPTGTSATPEEISQRTAAIIKSGKTYLCTNITATAARDLVGKGLVTEAECQAVGVL